MSESHVARANRRATAMRNRIGSDLRVARLGAGLTLVQVARAVGTSASELSRIERGAAPWVDLASLTRCAAVVGLDLWVRTYPGGEPLRDVAHLRLTDGFRSLVAPGLMIRAEVTIGDPRDLRAWDLTLTDRIGRHGGVELETRVTDAQDQLRRMTRKLADGNVDVLLLVVADTRANRAAVRAASATLAGVFSIDDSAAVDALRAGQLPPRNALLFVKVDRHPGVAVGREQTTSTVEERRAVAAARETGVRLAAPRRKR